jgi:hypothetical protein
MKESGAQRHRVARKASANARHSLGAGVENKWEPSRSPLLVADRVYPVEHLIVRSLEPTGSSSHVTCNQETIE